MSAATNRVVALVAVGAPGNRRPYTATAEDLRRYQLHLVETGVSPMSVNAAITGLRFFFEVTVERADSLAKMSPVRVPHKLPVILSREEVARLIECAGNDKLRIPVTTEQHSGEV
jgi:integrase/recombinase XerD